MDNQHSHAQNERERIIKQFIDIQQMNWTFEERIAEIIYDWHLAEVKRIVEPLVEHKKGYPEGSWEAMLESKVFYTVDVIDETLKRANGGE